MTGLLAALAKLAARATPFCMISSHPLTALADAEAALLAQLEPVAPRDVACAAAVGLIAADLAPLATPQPPRAIALREGYALRARDLSGASAFTPAFLANMPQRVALGDALPEGCDCVIDGAGLDLSGPMAQVFVESYPGENVRRSGEDFAAGAIVIQQGRKIDARDALIAARAGFARIPVRQPRVAILGAMDEISVFIAHLARVNGASVVEPHDADLVIVLGEAPAGADILTRGLALEPGRDCAIGRLGATPMNVLPRQPDQAFAGFIALVRPALARLSSRRPEAQLSLPLAAKISSRGGFAEVVLLQARDGCFIPLATGDWPLQALSRATHVALIGASSEGHGAGDILAADQLDV
jgi:molybdopterin molybdotransferase